MNLEQILEKLRECDFRVSTDTRKDLTGTVFFGIKGDNFDGNLFVREALEKGAVAAVTHNPENKKEGNENIFVVSDTLKTIQDVAREYRKTFTIPVIAIGGSNGKTTSKELLRNVLKTTYKTHATEGSLNNHIGLPLSILGMPKDTEMAVFEIGANHPGEHLELLNILRPTHVVVTNNGMDHLEGFGSPLGSRRANKEIYDWAKENNATVFVHKDLSDLLEDSKDSTRIMYPTENLTSKSTNPLEIECDGDIFKTHLFGAYNIQNIELAISIGENFNIKTEKALKAISEYIPKGKRSEIVEKDGITYIIDCYNANPTSMILALESFLALNQHIQHTQPRRGVVLGDMLELGDYSDIEHEKIVEFVLAQPLDSIVFIGPRFKKALDSQKTASKKYKIFEDSIKAKEWFQTQKWVGYTLLLKGSRGIRVEKVIE